MKARRDLLASCGFYCGDCLGYTGVIANAAQNLTDVLERYQFDRTAECVFPNELRDYARFCEMLGFMTSLRCPGICREGEQDSRSPGSSVKSCCRDKGFCACYESDDFETCNELRTRHKGLHTDSSVKNMEAIREMGAKLGWSRADDIAAGLSTMITHSSIGE